MICLLSRDYWSIGHQGEVNPRVGHQVRLELGQINVQSSIKSERGSDGGNNLSNQPESFEGDDAYLLNDQDLAATNIYVNGRYISHPTFNRQAEAASAVSKVSCSK